MLNTNCGKSDRFPMKEANSILNDIFSNPDGLVFPSTAEDYFNLLHHLEIKWLTIGDDAQYSNFVSYFKKNKADVLFAKSSLKIYCDVPYGPNISNLVRG
uniref:Uncharacterized protein n=1 Tax=Strigamia maritima TaxID=126957 RepID=T1IHX2_STRMM